MITVNRILATGTVPPMWLLSEPQEHHYQGLGQTAARRVSDVLIEQASRTGTDATLASHLALIAKLNRLT